MGPQSPMPPPPWLQEEKGYENMCNMTDNFSSF